MYRDVRTKWNPLASVQLLLACPCSGRMISHSLMCLYNICQSESGAWCVCKIQVDSTADSQTQSLTFQYQEGGRTGQDMVMRIIKYYPTLILSCKCE